jgi:hypothetical protein
MYLQNTEEGNSEGSADENNFLFQEVAELIF